MLDCFYYFCKSMRRFPHKAPAIFVSQLKYGYRMLLKMRYILVALFTLLTTSCMSEYANDYKGGFIHLTTPTEGVVESESQSVDIPERVASFSKMFIAKNTLMMFNDDGRSFYDAYTLPNLRFIDNLGKRKDLDGFHIAPYPSSIHVTGDRFEILDNGYIDSINIHYSELEVLGRTRIKGPTRELACFTILDTTLFAITPDPGLFSQKSSDPLDDCEIMIVNRYNGSVTKTGEFPPVMRQNGIETGIKVMTPNTSLRRFAVFYSLQKQLKLIDFNGEVLKSIAIDVPPYLNYETMSASNNWGNYVYYTDCTSSDKHIYALCRNESRKNYNTGKGAEKSEIHVFDWDGNFLKIIKLDEPISCFTVSESYGKIYCLSAKSPDKISVYSL